jgi:uncharacterized membrane protein YgcG
LQAAALVGAVFLGACASLPPPDDPPTLQEVYEPETVEVPTPLIEYPPIEPVEPPPAPVQPPEEVAPAPVAPPSPPPATVAMVAPPVIALPPPIVVRESSAEDQELSALLADLQRYAALPQADAQRELGAVTQVLGRQRTDANRVRLAMLYTLTRGPQDDQRALQLLDNVAKSNPGSPAVKQLAFVLQVQVAGRQRAVREEQLKADAALQKLEALRQMERSLLRDRVRSGGGGGASGGGGSGGCGGSGGGGQ